MAEHLPNRALMPREVCKRRNLLTRHIKHLRQLLEVSPPLAANAPMQDMLCLLQRDQVQQIMRLESAVTDAQAVHSCCSAFVTKCTDTNRLKGVSARCALHSVSRSL